MVEPVKLKEDYREDNKYIGKTYRRKHHKADHKSRKVNGRCGTASYYGKELAGRRTANGERFNPAGLTAASWHHEFGKRVTVTNPKNGRSVTVRINDRGPAKRLGRIIDLSHGAFKRIAASAQGLVKVCLS